MEYREVVKRLKATGDFKEFVNRGKGSHRMIGKKREDGRYLPAYPFPYHGARHLSTQACSVIYSGSSTCQDRASLVPLGKHPPTQPTFPLWGASPSQRGDRCIAWRVNTIELA